MTAALVEAVGTYPVPEAREGLHVVEVVVTRRISSEHSPRRRRGGVAGCERPEPLAEIACRGAHGLFRQSV